MYMNKNKSSLHTFLNYFWLIPLKVKFYINNLYFYFRKNIIVMFKNLLKFVIFISSILSLNVGCGYHLTGRGNNLPPYIVKIAIPTFKTSAYEKDIDKILTYAVIDEIERRGNFQIVDDEKNADAILYGEIKKTQYVPIGNPSYSNVTYRVFITISVNFYDAVKKRTIWKNENYVFTKDYYFSGDVSLFEKNRIQTWNEIAEDFARNLVGSILEGF